MDSRKYGTNRCRDSRRFMWHNKYNWEIENTTVWRVLEHENERTNSDFVEYRITNIRPPNVRLMYFSNNMFPVCRTVCYQDTHYQSDWWIVMRHCINSCLYVQRVIRIRFKLNVFLLNQSILHFRFSLFRIEKLNTDMCHTLFFYFILTL